MISNTSPVYQKEFFAVQLALAQKIAEIGHKPLEQVALHYTAFYRIFGLDWSFDPTNVTTQVVLGLQLSC